MRMFKPILAVTVVALFLAFAGFAEARTERVKGGKRITTYDRRQGCVVVCKGQKPFLELLEDGLAYALDLPLAMLSPITCPVVSPLMERYDSGPDRTYSRSRRR